MIKLKILLLESVVGYIGNVDHSGAVTGHEYFEPADQHPDYGLERGDKWRYFKKHNEVLWSDEPHSMDSIYDVNSWLSKRGIFPNAHYDYENGNLWSQKTEL